MQTITSPSSLALVAKSNPGLFQALFARAPKAITFKGKSYVRDSARTVEQRLWYLGAVAQTQPRALSAMAAGAYSLDEVYGLDPDRSAVDAAEAALRAATAKVGKARAALQAINRRIADAEARLREALDAQKKAQQVQIGDIFTAGISAAGRNLYADGQVQLWKDRIQSLKSGVLVGMAGQEGWAVPTNAGQTQLEGAVKDAQAEERAAREELKAAKAAYDEEARRMRQEEEAARQQQARDEAERKRADAEARARDAAALRAAQEAEAAANAAASGSYSSGYADPYGDPFAGQATDPGYVGDDGGEEWTGNEYGDEWYADSPELQHARDLFGDEELARAYAEDVLGADDEIAKLAFVSPWSFDRYYGADCDCDGCARGGGDCETVDTMRVAMLDAGWGFDADAALGYDSDAPLEADKITEEGDQGFSGLTPPPMPTPGAAGFDFMSLIPIIISAVLALAPLLIKAFGGPAPLEESEPPASTIAAVPVNPPPPPAPTVSSGEALGYGAVGLALLKFLG